MSQAYVATAEAAQIICAFNKDAAKALHAIASLYDEMQDKDEWTMLSSVNVGYDDEGFYHVTATVSTTAL